MKRFITLCIVILLLAGTVLLWAGEFTGISWKFKNTSVDVSTSTVSQIVAQNGNRTTGVRIKNYGGFTVLITSGAYSIAYSTTNAYPLKTTEELFFEGYVGPIYGLTTGTNVPVNIRVIEME